MIEAWDDTRDGAFSPEAMRKKLMARGYRVSCYTYPTGTYFPDHTHAVDKIDGVVSGTFKITMCDQEFILRQGDLLAVPKGRVHSAEVIGNHAVISLDAVR